MPACIGKSSPLTVHSGTEFPFLTASTAAVLRPRSLHSDMQREGGPLKQRLGLGTSAGSPGDWGMTDYLATQLYCLRIYAVEGPAPIFMMSPFFTS